MMMDSMELMERAVLFNHISGTRLLHKEGLLKIEKLDMKLTTKKYR